MFKLHVVYYLNSMLYMVRGQADWQNSKKNKGDLSIHLKRCEVPQDWSPVIDVVTKFPQMKIADGLAMAGDRGCYIFSLMDLDDEVRDALIKATRAIQCFLQKEYKPADWAKAHEQLVSAMAILEIK